MARKKPSPIGETLKNEAGEPIGHRSVYGVHKWEVYVDRADKPPSAIKRSLDKEKELVEAARAELKAAGEETDLEAVVGITDPMTESDVLMEWFEAIAARSYQVNKAFLSRPVLAARFLHALHTLRFPPPEVRGFDAVEVGIATHHATTAYYADAYYGWRFEFDGDHDKAFSKTVIADAAERGRARAMTKQNEREKIIVGAVKDLIDTDLTAGKIAKARTKTINAALDEHGWPQITNNRTLIRTLERIRERKARG